MTRPVELAPGPPRLPRRRFLAGLGAAACASGTAPAAGEKPEPFAAFLEAQRRRADLPALAAMAFNGTSLLEEAVTGLRLRTTPAAAVTRDDVFHIGSITKSMTAVLAAQFVEKGRLRWESTLGEVLDGFPLHRQVRPVTLWQLLRHRSGLRRDIPDGLYNDLKISDKPPIEQRRELARVMLAQPPEREPETRYEYSNAGYTFAGLMLETAAAQPWESLVTRDLFTPLELKSGGFGAPAKNPDQVDQPWGHRDDGTPVRPGPQADNVPAIGPAGTVHLSVPDLARYAQWHLRETAPKPGLITAGSLGRLHGAGQPDDYYGGWNRATRPWAAGQAITHTGTNTMFFAVLWLAPARDFGVLAACNQGGAAAEKACDAACAELIGRHGRG
jgi:CubicO group peptidase (beta-lactamase class C family)